MCQGPFGHVLHVCYNHTHTCKYVRTCICTQYIYTFVGSCVSKLFKKHLKLRLFEENVNLPRLPKPSGPNPMLVSITCHHSGRELNGIPQHGSESKEIRKSFLCPRERVNPKAIKSYQIDVLARANTLLFTITINDK